ncbi:MAG: hypothetical protein M0Z33_08505 [Actinomycetota bacterium]|nr:hypothetical protein [Actinomycetota bacterium]
MTASAVHGTQRTRSAATLMRAGSTPPASVLTSSAMRARRAAPAPYAKRFPAYEIR